VREILRDVQAQAERALQRTRAVVALGREAAQGEVTRLERIEREVADLTLRLESLS
jgi:hypothetical protein